MERIIESTVPGNFDGYRLDRYLAERFTYLSRSAWQREIGAGNISLNGSVVVNYHKRLKGGDFMSFTGRDIYEPEVDRDYALLYEDDDILAVNKPGNIPVHPSGRFFHNTLLMILQEDRGQSLFPVHRLDRETSGVILFAKNAETVSLLNRKSDSWEKIYLALVHGTVGEGPFMDNTPIGSDPRSHIQKRRAAYEGAPEEALTLFERISVFGKYSLVQATLRTGRQHQIRVHLLHQGYPIVGDKLYGLDERYYLEFIEKGYTPELLTKLGFPRSALHAWKLHFPHPRMGKIISVVAPLPRDMEEFIGGLEI
ncbi:MAG: RluA family pseudouridine synthase [Spirochaetae bacterium HGW-Spirochaetae-1]|jgi:RluA family pseudouridine synthase|nr:MAG: RluA family pseudouridine synthase [Spirochaetae bacterium HGW-Spirochaetae-1]